MPTLQSTLRGLLFASLMVMTTPHTAHAAEPVFQGQKVTSIGVVTRDVEKTAKRYATIFGAKNWTLFDDVVDITTYKNGKSETHHARVRSAVGTVKDLQFELIQGVPNTPFGDFLAQRGRPSAHHYSIGSVADADGLIEKLKAAHYDVLMQVRRHDGAVTTYTATEKELGAPVAFTSMPKDPSMRKPVRTLTFDEPGFVNMSDKRLVQLAFNVPDGAGMAKHYETLFGGTIRPGALTMLEVVRGDKPVKGETDQKFTFFMIGNLQIELIEPVKNDATPYAEFVKKNGAGIQHMSFGSIPDAAETEAAFRKAGYIRDWGGTFRSNNRVTEFAYMNTFDIGFDTEFLYKVPAP